MNQPASNSFAFVTNIQPNYNAENKSFTFICSPFTYSNEKNELITLEFDALKTNRKAAVGRMIEGEYFSSGLEYFGMDSQTFVWPCEVELARNLKTNDLFRVAIVFKLGPRGMSGRDAGTPKDYVLAGQDYSPLEPRIHYNRYAKKNVFRNRLWLKENSRIFVFRSDTGEILIDSASAKSVESSEASTPGLGSGQSRMGGGSLPGGLGSNPGGSTMSGSSLMGKKFGFVKNEDSYDVVVAQPDGSAEKTEPTKKVGAFPRKKDRKLFLQGDPVLSPQENFAVAHYHEELKRNNSGLDLDKAKPSVIRLIEVMSTKTVKIVASIPFDPKSKGKKIFASWDFSPKEGFLSVSYFLQERTFLSHLCYENIADLADGTVFRSDEKIKRHYSDVLRNVPRTTYPEKPRIVDGFSFDDKLLVFKDGSYMTLADRTIFKTGKEVSEKEFQSAYVYEYEFDAKQIEQVSRESKLIDRNGPGSGAGLPGWQYPICCTTLSERVLV